MGDGGRDARGLLCLPPELLVHGLARSAQSTESGTAGEEEERACRALLRLPCVCHSTRSDMRAVDRTALRSLAVARVQRAFEQAVDAVRLAAYATKMAPITGQRRTVQRLRSLPCRGAVRLLTRSPRA